MLRGLEQRHEQDPGMLLRDTRPLGKRIVDFFHDPGAVAIVLAAFAASCLVIPGIADLLAIIGIGCFIYAYTRKSKLPYRMPQYSGMLDYNDPVPGSQKPQKAQ